jgi:hypothetical protein
MVNSFGYGVGIFNLEHPTQPIIASRYTGTFDEIVASNNQMYAAAHWQEGLHQVDVRNPALPRQTANLYDVSVDAMVLTSTHLYALLNGYLAVLDVANYGEMNLLNELDLSPEEYGPYRSISVLENLVYAQSQSGITLLDISNPAAYSEIGFIPADETICALTVRNSYVFVFSASYCGRDSESKYVIIYDAANPTMIQAMGKLEIDFYVEKMTTKGDNLYLFGDDLTVIDVSQLNSPQITNHFPTPGYAQDAVLVNDLIYVADGAGGLLILQMTE